MRLVGRGSWENWVGALTQLARGGHRGSPGAERHLGQGITPRRAAGRGQRAAGWGGGHAWSQPSISGETRGTRVPGMPAPFSPRRQAYLPCPATGPATSVSSFSRASLPAGSCRLFPGLRPQGRGLGTRWAVRTAAKDQGLLFGRSLPPAASSTRATGFGQGRGPSLMAHSSGGPVTGCAVLGVVTLGRPKSLLDPDGWSHAGIPACPDPPGVDTLHVMCLLNTPSEACQGTTRLGRGGHRLRRRAEANRESRWGRRSLHRRPAAATGPVLETQVLRPHPWDQPLRLAAKDPGLPQDRHCSGPANLPREAPGPLHSTACGAGDHAPEPCPG